MICKVPKSQHSTAKKTLCMSLVSGATDLEGLLHVPRLQNLTYLGKTYLLTRPLSFTIANLTLTYCTMSQHLLCVLVSCRAPEEGCWCSSYTRKPYLYHGKMLLMLPYAKYHTLHCRNGVNYCHDIPEFDAFCPTNAPQF